MYLNNMISDFLPFWLGFGTRFKSLFSVVNPWPKSSARYIHVFSGWSWKKKTFLYKRTILNIKHQKDLFLFFRRDFPGLFFWTARLKPFFFLGPNPYFSFLFILFLFNLKHTKTNLKKQATFGWCKSILYGKTIGMLLWRIRRQ